MNSMLITRNAALLCAAFFLASAQAADLSDLKTGGPYVPTPQSVVDTMLRIAAVTEKDYVIDLGSGDGVIVLTAARFFKASGMGVDIDPDLVKQSNASAQKLGLSSRVRFVQADVFKADLSNASVLTLYLLPSMMLNLRTKILSELKPGVRVVSHDYHFGDWRPDEGVTFDVPEKASITGVPTATVNLWHVPAKVAGTWEVKIEGARAYELALTQRFQSVEGAASSAGKALKPHYLTLRGNEFEFALPDGKALMRFNGRVSGDAMEGSLDAPGRPAQRWTATRTATGKVVID